MNVRATLLGAVRARVVQTFTARRVLRAAMRLHFSRRTWEAVLEESGRRNGQGLARLARWLPENRVDLKRRDALDCIRWALSVGEAPPARPLPPATVFTAALTRTRPQRPA